MSDDRSRSKKFTGVREKLFRLRCEYFCIRSSERRSDCDPCDVSVDPSARLTPLDTSVLHRHSHDGQRPATADPDGRPLRRHSVPSCFFSIPESPDETETSDSPSAADDATQVDSTSVNVSSSIDNDHAEYDEFVRGLQATTATATYPQQTGAATEMSSAGNVCCSTKQPVSLEGTVTPCCLVDKMSSTSRGRRSLGGKLIRTLRKTFSMAGLGRTEDIEVNDLSAKTGRPVSSSYDKRLSYLRHCESTTLVGKSDDNLGQFEWQPAASLTVRAAMS